MQTCPRCKRINSDAADQCDCGYPLALRPPPKGELDLTKALRHSEKESVPEHLIENDDEEDRAAKARRVDKQWDRMERHDRVISAAATGAGLGMSAIKWIAIGCCIAIGFKLCS